MWNAKKKELTKTVTSPEFRLFKFRFEIQKRPKSAINTANQTLFDTFFPKILYIIGIIMIYKDVINPALPAVVSVMPAY